MPNIKRAVESRKNRIWGIWKDFWKLPDDTKDYVRQRILRQPQTLSSYNIVSTKQKELLDAIMGFQSNYSKDITNGIANRLLHIMDIKNFPIDTDKLADIYVRLRQIDRWNQSDEEKELAKQEVLNDLTSQDILSLQIYNYNSNFWNTHLKDWNKLNDLVLFQPNKRPEKIEWMEDILKAVLDLWPLNKLSSSIVKKISDILERWVWAWVQHTIEIAFHPNI